MMNFMVKLKKLKNVLYYGVCKNWFSSVHILKRLLPRTCSAYKIYVLEKTEANLHVCKCQKKDTK